MRKRRDYTAGMKRKMAAGVLAYFVLALWACSAQGANHIKVAGRDVAVWRPLGTAPAIGHPLILFSHGFGGCNTQSEFLMHALAKAGYLVLAPNTRSHTLADRIGQTPFEGAALARLTMLVAPIKT
jgi:predicted dienelactone hydrolase